MTGITGAVAVVAFAVIFLLMAGTYLGDAQDRRDAACAAAVGDTCDDARRDANVAMGITLGVAALAGVGAFFITGRLVRGTRTEH